MAVKHGWSWWLTRVDGEWWQMMANDGKQNCTRSCNGNSNSQSERMRIITSIWLYMLWLVAGWRWWWTTPRKTSWWRQTVYPVLGTRNHSLVSHSSTILKPCHHGWGWYLAYPRFKYQVCHSVDHLRGGDILGGVPLGCEGYHWWSHDSFGSLGDHMWSLINMVDQHHWPLTIANYNKNRHIIDHW